MSIGDGCEFKYVIMHELGHVIGFFHEHQRADRDEFVEILWDNVMNCKGYLIWDNKLCLLLLHLMRIFSDVETILQATKK